MDPLYVILIGIILIGLVFFAISIAEDRKEKKKTSLKSELTNGLDN
jgi:preprotein translocase subunit YajC